MSILLKIAGIASLGILGAILDLKELFIVAFAFIFAALYVINERVGKIKESLEKIEIALGEIHQQR